MAQTLFSRCTRKLSRSVCIQMTHHQLVLYETTHGPLKQLNIIKTTRPTWIMNNGLCSLPGLIKMKETVIWFRKSHSCLYQICLWWSRGVGRCWPCWTLFASALIFPKQLSALPGLQSASRDLNLPHYSIHNNTIIRNLMPFHTHFKDTL